MQKRNGGRESVCVWGGGGGLGEVPEVLVLLPKNLNRRVCKHVVLKYAEKEVRIGGVFSVPLR